MLSIVFLKFITFLFLQMYMSIGQATGGSGNFTEDNTTEIVTTESVSTASTTQVAALLCEELYNLNASICDVECVSGGGSYVSPTTYVLTLPTCRNTNSITITRFRTVPPSMIESDVTNVYLSALL